MTMKTSALQRGIGLSGEWTASFLRIAVPSFRFRADDTADPVRPALSREEIAALFRKELGPVDTEGTGETRQRDLSRRIRAALYSR